MGALSRTLPDCEVVSERLNPPPCRPMEQPPSKPRGKTAGSTAAPSASKPKAKPRKPAAARSKTSKTDAKIEKKEVKVEKKEVKVEKVEEEEQEDEENIGASGARANGVPNTDAECTDEVCEAAPAVDEAKQEEEEWVEEEDPVEKKCPNLFELEVEKGIHIKVLFDILFYLMRSEIHLIVTKNNVYYSDSDADGKLVGQFEIKGDKCRKYKAPSMLKEDNQTMIISLPSQSMQHATKAKVKEEITITIAKEMRELLCVDIASSHGSETTTNRVRIGTDENYTPVDPPKYPESLRAAVKIAGKLFNEKCRSLVTFGAQTTISIQAEGMRMVAGSTDSHITEPKFGTWVPGAPIIFEGTFASAMLAQIGKCGTISEQVSIYACKDKPLKIVSDIGAIGTIYLHLYTKV